MLARTQAAEEWRRRVIAEYRSASITHSLVGWLLQLGASPTLLHEGIRIIDDELVHAEMAFAVLSETGENVERIDFGAGSLGLGLDLTSRPVDLIAEGFDVAIRLGPLPDSQLFARKLGAMTMGAYAAPEYLKRASAPIAPSDLRGHECLRLRGQAEGSSAWTLMRGAQVVAVDVKGRVVANAMRVLLELAADGLGVALLGEAFAAQAVGDGRLVRVLPEWNTGVDQVHALTPSKLIPSRTRIFLDSLSEHLRAPSRTEAPKKKRDQ